MTEATASTLAGWLAFSQNADVELSLSRDEARRRAGELRRLISAGLVSAEDLELTEEAKDVLWALLELISESSNTTPGALISEADRIYRFVRELDWTPDSFDEQQEILHRIAAAGWAAIGLTLDDVAARRRGATGNLSGTSAGSSLTDAHRRWILGSGITRSKSECTTPDAPGGIHESRVERDLAPNSTQDAAQIAECVWQDKAEACECVLNLEVLLAICSVLSERRELSPARAAELGERTYNAIVNSPRIVFALFDEREYILGELACHAAVANRFLGKCETADRWLDWAEANFRQVINPAPYLANTAYVRLTIRYSTARYNEVLERLPSVLANFEKFGMRREAAKCRFLEALSVKALGRGSESLALLRDLRVREEIRTDPTLLGHVFLNMGDVLTAIGRFDEACEAYDAALPILSSGDRPIQLAELRWSLGDACRSQGNLRRAVALYRESQRSYAELKLPNYLAILHVVTAETLITLGRYREAEYEILAALPTIEEQKMVPEGFAAVALLKESIRRRKTDPNALRELREHLQANR